MNLLDGRGMGREGLSMSLLPLPFSDFSSVFSKGWLPGTTEMTRRLFPPLFFWVTSESSLLLAESLSADREDEEGLLDSLGVFLSSPEG